MSGDALLVRQDVAAPLSHRESEDAPSPTTGNVGGENGATLLSLSRLRNTNKYSLTRSLGFLSLTHSPLPSSRSLYLSPSTAITSISISLPLQPSSLSLQTTLSLRLTRSHKTPPVLSLSRRSRNLSFFLDLSHPQSPSPLSTFIVLKSTFKLSQSE